MEGDDTNGPAMNASFLPSNIGNRTSVVNALNLQIDSNVNPAISSDVTRTINLVNAQNPDTRTESNGNDNPNPNPFLLNKAAASKANTQQEDVETEDLNIKEEANLTTDSYDTNPDNASIKKLGCTLGASNNEHRRCM